MSLDLFDKGPRTPGNRQVVPLADRMRPRDLDEVLGQDHLLGRSRPFRRAIDGGRFGSMVLWGPPGSGKTTLARLIAQATSCRFVHYSAVTAGVREIREVVAAARQAHRSNGQATILFIDEIHRFNKAQQDAFLPHVESGLIILIGATTENPSFEVNAALLSRLQVFVLHPLGVPDLLEILQRALRDPERGLGKMEIEYDGDVLEAIAVFAGGDARVALSVLEACARVADPPRRLTRDLVEQVAGRPIVRHDRSGDQHYALISALIKSIRGSDADAAVYWLARIIEGGEDPLFVARRLVILASEDIGNADPQALPLAVAAFQAVHAVGMPEAALTLSQAAIYLALAPKSNTATIAIHRASADARRTGTLAVPLHLRNAPTSLMKRLGFGRDYRYSHSEDDRLQDYLPPELRDRRYVELGDRGYEAEQALRQAAWRSVRERARAEGHTADPGEARTGEEPPP